MVEVLGLGELGVWLVSKRKKRYCGYNTDRRIILLEHSMGKGWQRLLRHRRRTCNAYNSLSITESNIIAIKEYQVPEV